MDFRVGSSAESSMGSKEGGSSLQLLPPPPPADMTTKTCAPCRSRKIKCDGTSPICGPCTRSKRTLICGYPSGSLTAKADVKEVLPKGAACLPCRRKKKKCDAKRPYCDTCKAGGREYECNYEGDDGYSHIQALLKRNRELEETLRQYEEQESRGARSSPSGSSPELDLFAKSDWSQNLDGSSITSAFDSPVGPHPKRTRGPNTVRLDGYFCELLGSTTSGSNRPREIMIPPASVLLKSPKSDIDMIFRAIFLAHRHQYGFWLPPLKLQALFMGDISGAIVHPCLVHLAHLWGCLLLQEYEGSFTLGEVENSHMYAAVSAIDEANCDPIVLVQGYTLLLMYFTYKHSFLLGEEYATKAAAIVKKYGLMLSPSRDNKDDPAFVHTGNQMYGGWEACAAVQEQTSILAQLLFTQIDSYLLLHRPVNALCADLENQFRDDLPVIYPNLCKTNVNLLRTRSLLLTKDSYRLIAALQSHFTSGWLQSYWDLLAQLKQHISYLDSFLLKTSYSAEREVGLTIKFCSIICYCTEAELHRQLAAYGHSESRRQCRESLFRVINASQELEDQDYYFLDPLLVVCWSGSIEALKQLQTMRRSPSPQGTEQPFSSGRNSSIDPELQNHIFVLNDSIRKLKQTVPYLAGQSKALSLSLVIRSMQTMAAPDHLSTLPNMPMT